MTVLNSNQPPLAARTLKLAGTILILSFLLDLAILLFPSGARDVQWQINLASSLVDRGVVPLIGIALITVGYWVDSSLDREPSNYKVWLDLRLWAFLLSSILGLIYLLLFPLHVNNARLASDQRIEQISQRATQAETELQAQLNQLGDQQTQAEIEQQRTQLRERVNQLLKNEELYKQALQSGQISAAEKKLLQEFKANPQLLDQYLAQKTDPQALGNQKLEQIRDERTQLTQQAKQEAWRSSLRTGVSSVILAIGYIAIGWMGLRNLITLASGRHKSGWH